MISACQAGEAGKVSALLSESAWRRKERDDSGSDDYSLEMMKEMEFFLPHCIAKSPEEVETGYEAREELTDYVLKMEPMVIFSTERDGRNALHSASYLGDLRFVRRVLAASNDRQGKNWLPDGWMERTCIDSGWTPLHYAVAFGSIEIMEMFLAEGCSVQCRTDKSRTCRTR